MAKKKKGASKSKKAAKPKPRKLSAKKARRLKVAAAEVLERHLDGNLVVSRPRVLDVGPTVRTAVDRHFDALVDDPEVFDQTVKQLSASTGVSRDDVERALHGQISERLDTMIKDALALAPARADQRDKPVDLSESWADFTDDRPRVDAAITLCAKEWECSWIDALERTMATAESVRNMNATCTVGDVFKRLPISLAEVSGRVYDVDDRAKTLAADAVLSGEAPAVEPDALGRVPFASDVDVDDLLDQPTAAARAFRQASRLGLPVGDQDSFERSWRPLAEAGFDLVATMRADRQSGAQELQKWKQRDIDDANAERKQRIADLGGDQELEDLIQTLTRENPDRSGV